MIQEVKKCSGDLIDSLVDIWEASVRATHTFLNNEEVLTIKKEVPAALAAVEQLFIMTDETDKPIAFMGIEGKRLEMLFVTPQKRGKGIGKELVTYGIEAFDIDEVTVNEQNTQAIRFYSYLGFVVVKRTERDESGREYPLLYMRLTR